MPDLPTNEGIDFIPKYPHQTESLKQQLFKLVITRGKTIIVVTEAIVLLVFLSRFKLDRQIQDLTESLDNKEAIIQSTQNIEKEYRDVQNKLNITVKLIDSQTNWYKKINAFDNEIPTGVTFKKIDYSQGAIDLSAQAQSASVFGAFMRNLIANESIKSVAIESSAYNVATQSFSFSLSIKTT